MRVNDTALEKLSAGFRRKVGKTDKKVRIGGAGGGKAGGLCGQDSRFEGGEGLARFYRCRRTAAGIPRTQGILRRNSPVHEKTQKNERVPGCAWETPGNVDQQALFEQKGERSGFRAPTT